eukprot:Tbor_TRINITY_DN5743_c0_g1::TRINITY_DN5743_c0_g1_i5::g.20375::m.20375
MPINPMTMICCHSSLQAIHTKRVIEYSPNEKVQTALSPTWTEAMYPSNELAIIRKMPYKIKIVTARSIVTTGASAYMVPAFPMDSTYGTAEYCIAKNPVDKSAINRNNTIKSLVSMMW